MRRKSRSRALRALNPLGAFAAGAEDDRVRRAIEVARAARPELPSGDAEWFGWPLPDEPRHRYAAVGCEGRGFVVDVVSGHVIWDRPIEHRRELPRSMADAVARG